MTSVAHSSGLHKPRGDERRRHDAGNLRSWLHAIDEAAAGKDATPEVKAIRDAALAALRGDRAPKRFGLVPEE